ncbi:MAG: retron system putative HNH endonuclease [Myxococcota bacterium]
MKGKEPKEWLAFRKQGVPSPRYDDGPKEPLRAALLAEQGHLCCYCMRRITGDSMKIEHWAPKGRFPELALDYRNLLGACFGGEARPGAMPTADHQHHCDTSKKDQSITLDPRERSCERKIGYVSGSGKLIAVADDAATSRDIEVLGLNRARLEAGRKAAFDGVRIWAEKSGKSLTVKKIEAKIGYLETPGADGKLDPFVGAMVWWLRRRLRKGSP